MSTQESSSDFIRWSHLKLFHSSSNGSVRATVLWAAHWLLSVALLLFISISYKTFWLRSFDESKLNLECKLQFDSVVTIYPGGKVLMKKGFISIAIFISVRHPLLRTHFLLNPKYCSGFIFPAIRWSYLKVAVLYNLAVTVSSIAH